MKPHASVLAVAGAIALAALAGLTVACSPSSVTEPPEPISASPLTASASPSPSPSPAFDSTNNHTEADSRAS
jgi:hypothetical protein